MKIRKSETGRTRFARVGIIALAVIGMALVGCSDDEEEGEGEEERDPCSQRDDCSPGELCEEGFCVEPEGEVQCEEEMDCPVGMLCKNNEICVELEGPTDCESTDECADGMLCVDGACEPDPLGPYGDPVTMKEESYRASYLADWVVGDDETSEVHIVPGVDGEREVIDTGDIDCQEMHRCVVSEDETHLLVVEATGDGYDVLAAPLEGDPLAVSGDATALVESVQRPWIRGNGVAYERAQAGFYVAFYQSYDGDEVELVTLHDTEGSQRQHSWDYHPQSGRIAHFIPIGLDALDIVVDSSEGGNSVVTNLDGANRPAQAGSYYLGTTRAGFSDDGRFVAFETTGPNNHESCSDAGDCSQPGHDCGSQGRCVAIEPTVNVIDMEFADHLGEPCTGHDDCGPVNRCDSGSENFDQGTCQPQRIIVGLPTQGDTNHSGGCAVTREDGSFRFTDVVTPLTFGPDQRVYFVGKRDCVRSAADTDTDVEADIPRTSIVAGDLQTGEYEEIWGNIDGDDYYAASCGAAGEVAEDDCTLFIENVRLSPGGQDLIFKASTPLGSPGRATSNLDVWRVTREGEEPIRIGGLSGTHSATEVRVHGDGVDDDGASDSDEEAPQGESEEDGENGESSDDDE